MILSILKRLMYRSYGFLYMFLFFFIVIVNNCVLGFIISILYVLVYVFFIEILEVRIGGDMEIRSCRWFVYSFIVVI